ncbi:MAG TPA: c-type cytochrome [Polyangium sp.]|nr:c-type cytochrome [Polyangium sp.]
MRHDRFSRTNIARGLLPALLVATAITPACSNKSGDVSAGTGTIATASATSSSAASSSTAAVPAAEKRPARSLQGSAIALSPDGKQALVAGEDHLALFLMPTDFADASGVRVVDAPGPPAQIVALSGLVLVTVRTLPTDDARAALEGVRGPAPTPAGARTYPTSQLERTTRWMKQLRADKLEEWLDGKLSLAQKEDEKKRPSGAKTPGAGSAASPRTSASAAKSPPPPAKQNTPARRFDPTVTRKSQGGLLVGYRPDPDKGLVEAFRIAVAPDAWGVAVTPDEKRAIVTSAFSSEIAVIDLETKKVVTTFSTAREPRGIAISADGKIAYVSHLVGAALTKITGLDAIPQMASVALPPAPLRTPIGWELSASLGYSLVFSPDQKSLYVPRHALGAEGIGSWWGAPTVDVLNIPTEKHAAPKHGPGLPGAAVKDEFVTPSAEWDASVGQAPAPRFELVQPRAVVYRRKTNTLLVASEGWDTLAELDARTVDPAMFLVRTYDLARVYDVFSDFPLRGGAPSGIVLSENEDTAYVFCRSTFDVARIELSTGKADWLKLAEDGLPADAAHGRSLFTNARSPNLSGGLGCAACHPEGRDDGFVWREGRLDFMAGPGSHPADNRFIGVRANIKLNDGSGQNKRDKPPLYPRQTPIIAGRLRSPGPYGWHAESKDVVERLMQGAYLHREGWRSGYISNLATADALIDYALSGLLPPPTLAHELSEREKKGKEIFESKQAACSTCHNAEGGYTDRIAYTLPALPTQIGFDKEENQAWKTPSLWFVAGTGPYFHDGSVATLEELIKKNGNRMGQTSHLSPDDQAALVAYLKTL